MSKYVFVVPSLSSGGAERAVANFSNALVSKGKKVTIIKYFDTNQDYSVSDQVKVINLSGADQITYDKLRYFEKIKKLHNMFEKENPDVIIPFLPQVTIHAFWAGFSHRSKIIYTIRNNPAKSPGNRLFRILRNFIIATSKKTIVQNAEQRNYFPMFVRKKCFVLFNIVSKQFFEIKKDNYHKDVFNIVALGRLIEQKNYPVLIAAMDIVTKKYSNIHLYIYGEGVLREKLQHMIKSKNLNRSISLMGRVENVADVYKHSDIFVLSSDFEGMPNALAEAMASGTACISTNCPTGPKDMISDNKDGILVSVGNSNEIASAIEYLYNNPDVRRSMGVLAREKMMNICSQDAVIDTFIQICEDPHWVEKS